VETPEGTNVSREELHSEGSYWSGMAGSWMGVEITGKKNAKKNPGGASGVRGAKIVPVTTDFIEGEDGPIRKLDHILSEMEGEEEMTRQN